MDRKLFLLVDYKGHFGSKYKAVPYRSGFDRSKLVSHFGKAGYDVTFFNPSDPGFDKQQLKEGTVLYTSAEDKGLFYKRFLSDFIFSLEQASIRCLPSHRYLLMHENKVLFEHFRHLVFNDQIDGLQSWCFGTLEDFRQHSGEITFPVVIKTSEGSMSKGTFLAKDEQQALRIARRISATHVFKQQLRDLIRGIRHRGYLKESWHRKGFVCQQYISGLKNDWKVLIFNEKYYVLRRGIREGDFRASGQGLLGYEQAPIPGLLDFAAKIFGLMDVPMCSLDICFDGNRYYLLEAQLLFFGTYTLEFSEFWFMYDGQNWNRIEGRSELEAEYVNSICMFLNR